MTQSTRNQLFSLASTHEWNLAYNSSDPVRAIAGSVLGGQVIDFLQDLVDGGSSVPKLNIQFGAYGTFMAFFGLAQLPSANPDFYGICNYASSMVFELVTNATKPTPEDISVRFMFANGTATNDGLTAYPLFGQQNMMMSWSDFKSEASKIAINDDEHWCKLCGESSDMCSTNDSGSGVTGANSTESKSQISAPLAGVIGALVTLAVVLGLEILVMLVGGIRLIKKSARSKSSQANLQTGAQKA